MTQLWFESKARNREGNDGTKMRKNMNSMNIEVYNWPCHAMICRLKESKIFYIRRYVLEIFYFFIFFFLHCSIQPVLLVFRCIQKGNTIKTISNSCISKIALIQLFVMSRWIYLKTANYNDSFLHKYNIYFTHMIFLYMRRIWDQTANAHSNNFCAYLFGSAYCIIF